MKDKKTKFLELAKLRVNKTIKSNTMVSIYDISGRLVLKTNSHSTNISHLYKGVYILKSEHKTQKITLN